MSISILSTKLHIPQTRSDIVLRTRLSDLLNRTLDSKLTLISAPAGSGKTTLLSLWLDSVDIGIAWLSLEESDSDLKRFLQYLIAALQTVDQTIGDDLISLLGLAQQPPIENILTLLLNDIVDFDKPIVLVLDDYHQVDSQAVDKALIFLLDHLPPHMHIIVTTREDPQLPLNRLRSRGQLLEIRAADLRFSSVEMQHFLNDKMGLSLTSSDILALEARTEGWIAGLQLAAIAMQRHENKTSFIESFTGSHRFIVDYLLDEVFQQQSEDVHQFLIQTSVLDRLNADLCNALTQRTDSQAMLEQLERSNLFIIPLDDTRYWYRYHHLFAEALQSRLKSMTPDEMKVFHKRASLWYEVNNFQSYAIQHALLAQDNELTTRLLELVWSEMNAGYRSDQWFMWAKQLPKKTVLDSPVLCLGYAWSFINQGDFQNGEAYLKRAEDYLIDHHDGSIVEDIAQFELLPASIASARAYLSMAMGQVDNTIHYAKQSLLLTTDPSQLSHRQASALLGFASWAIGDLKSSYSALHDYMVAMRNIDNLSDAIAITAYLGELRIELGELHEAHHIYQDVLRRMNGGSPPLGTEEFYRGLAELYLEWGDLDKARVYLDMSKQLGEHMSILTWRQRYDVTEAQYHLMFGDYDKALQFLDSAERHYLQTAMPDVKPLAAQKARIWIKQGRLNEADVWAKQQSLFIGDDLHYLNEYKYITLARLLIAQYQHSKTAEYHIQAVDLLARLLQKAHAGSRLRTLIEIFILQAQLAIFSNDLHTAMNILNHAIDLAAPQDYIYLFISEGDDLKQLLKQSHHPYAKHLSSTFPDVSILSDAKAHAGLLDALSEREIDVLQMMAEGLTNPEIAERLYISKHTVKVHTRNIYSKLDVNNRTQAVTEARSLGIISE